MFWALLLLYCIRTVLLLLLPDTFSPRVLLLLIPLVLFRQILILPWLWLLLWLEFTIYVELLARVFRIRSRDLETKLLLNFYLYLRLNRFSKWPYLYLYFYVYFYVHFYVYFILFDLIFLSIDLVLDPRP